jgi:repressor LexA
MQISEILNNTELEAIRFIRNSLAHKGKLPTVRELMQALEYKSPRSASVVIEQLKEKGILKRRTDGSIQFRDIESEGKERAQTVDVPLLGLVACGKPIFAEENISAVIPVSVKLAKPPHKYFFLRAKGDSMNKEDINDGDMVLIRQQNTAKNGDLVVALIDDEATIKEFYKHGATIILKPCSTNSGHQPIILTNDFQIQGIVITAIPNI